MDRLTGSFDWPKLAGPEDKAFVFKIGKFQLIKTAGSEDKALSSRPGIIGNLACGQSDLQLGKINSWINV